MKVLLTSLTILFLIQSCNNNDDDSQNDNQITLEWLQQESIPIENLRFSASIVSYNNEAYLLPGKGGTRFSFKPEILKFSNNNWTDIATYDGFATAGGSSTFINDDLIYILGGSNSSGVPTDQVRTFSITNNLFNDESFIPNGPTSLSSAASTQTTGYIAQNSTINPDLIFDVAAYNFASSIWTDIPSPPINEATMYSLMTSENNIVYILFTELETNNFFALDENSNEWVELSDFPGDSRTKGVIVSTTTDIYTGLGTGERDFSDIWKYDIASNQWIEFTQYPGTHFNNGFAFELDGDLFFGGGVTETIVSDDALNNEMYRLNIN